MTVSTDIRYTRSIETTASIKESARTGLTAIYDRVCQILGYDVRGIEHPSQSWFWAESWQRREHKADEDIVAGRTTVYQSGDDFLNSLI